MSSIFRVVQVRLDEKLGRCPFCMRAALIGATVGWVATAVVSVLSGSTVLVLGTVLVAAAFTVVAVSHLIAYVTRVARSLRDQPDPAPATETAASTRLGEPGHLDRRDFMTTLVRAGTAFMVVAVFGRLLAGRASAQGGCLPTSLANQVCADGANENEAIEAAFLAAQTACDTLCEGLSCAGGSRCLRSTGAGWAGPPPECGPNDRGGVRCCIRVTCPCACFTCSDVVPASTAAVGAATNVGDAWSNMLTDAKNKCEAFCKKVDNCPDKKPNCRLNGTAKVKAKQKENCTKDKVTGVITCRGTIENCPCKCGKGK